MSAHSKAPPRPSTLPPVPSLAARNLAADLHALSALAAMARRDEPLWNELRPSILGLLARDLEHHVRRLLGGRDFPETPAR